MAINKLTNVPESKKFWLADGRGISNLRELYEIMKVLPNETFSYHVNETKNDFYNWIKDVYGDKKLADDLLECTNKETMLFCLKSNIEGAESVNIFNELPKENIMENLGETKLIFNELPKKNVLERVKIPTKKKNLVTMLDPSVFKRKAVKPIVPKKKTTNNSLIKPKIENEKFNKSQIKKIKVETSSEMINRLKEVYEID